MWALRASFYSSMASQGGFGIHQRCHCCGPPEKRASGWCGHWAWACVLRTRKSEMTRSYLLNCLTLLQLDPISCLFGPLRHSPRSGNLSSVIDLLLMTNMHTAGPLIMPCSVIPFDF